VGWSANAFQTKSADDSRIHVHTYTEKVGCSPEQPAHRNNLERRMTKKLIAALSLIAAVGTPQAVFADDAVSAYPDQYTVESENDRVRVIRIHYEPGQKTGMHSHGLNVSINLTGGKFLMTLPDGSSQEVDGTAGQATINEAGEHAMENIGDTPFDGLLVELKD